MYDFIHNQLAPSMGIDTRSCVLTTRIMGFYHNAIPHYYKNMIKYMGSKMKNRWVHKKMGGKCFFFYFDKYTKTKLIILTASSHPYSHMLEYHYCLSERESEQSRETQQPPQPSTTTKNSPPIVKLGTCCQLCRRLLLDSPPSIVIFAVVYCVHRYSLFFSLV